MKPPVPLVKPPTSTSPGKPAAQAARQVKTFSVAPFTGAGEGEKVVIYGKTGNGKTTLAAQLPDAVFLALDDGGRKIIDPVTHKAVNSVPGIATFEDLRDALHQSNLFPDKGTIVIDTLTKTEEIMEPYIFQHCPLKSGKATSMRAYGWDGPAHLLDCMRLILTDLDTHVRQGRNVVLLCQQAQVRVPNSEGMDYLEDGPKLQHNNQYSNRAEVCEWADHVLRIGYQDFEVRTDSDKAKAGKVVSDMTRAIFTGGAAHYVAKSRPIDGLRLPSVVSFATPEDQSLWLYMFHGALKNQ
jgi:energy-coupling factor transporter ATP-binding protein EcfA2